MKLWNLFKSLLSCQLIFAWLLVDWFRINRSTFINPYITHSIGTDEKNLLCVHCIVLNLFIPQEFLIYYTHTCLMILWFHWLHPCCYCSSECLDRPFWLFQLVPSSLLLSLFEASSSSIHSHFPSCTGEKAKELIHLGIWLITCFDSNNLKNTLTKKWQQ